MRVPKVHVCFHGKSSDINYVASVGSAPAAMASPVAIVPYYLHITVQICSMPAIQRHRYAPPPPMGSGLAQGGYHRYEKSFLQSTNNETELRRRGGGTILKGVERKYPLFFTAGIYRVKTR